MNSDWLIEKILFCFLDVEDEFAEDESNTCKNYALHAGYGPWCFSTMDDTTGQILWAPCYVNCQDTGDEVITSFFRFYHFDQF